MTSRRSFLRVLTGLPVVGVLFRPTEVKAVERPVRDPHDSMVVALMAEPHLGYRPTVARLELRGGTANFMRYEITLSDWLGRLHRRGFPVFVGVTEDEFNRGVARTVAELAAQMPPPRLPLR